MVSNPELSESFFSNYDAVQIFFIPISDSTKVFNFYAPLHSSHMMTFRGPSPRKSAKFVIFCFMVKKGPYVSGNHVLKFYRANATINPPKNCKTHISHPFAWLAQFETPAL